MAAPTVLAAQGLIRARTVESSTVTNEQTRGSYSNKIRGQHVTLLKPHNGMEVGAENKVAVAKTYMRG